MLQSNTDTTYSSKNGRSKRALVLLFLIGVACLAIGMIAFEDNEEDFHLEAATAYLTTLTDHQDFTSKQRGVIEKLIEEGEQNKEQMIKDMELLNLSKADMKTRAGPAMTGATNSLTKNVKWGQNINNNVVDTKKMNKSFENSANFAIEINKMFPASYKQILKLRQDLKLHHFDLSNMIHDVSLLAEQTKQNLQRVKKRLLFRGKLKMKGKLSPSYDLKIWKMEIKSLVGDLEVSLKDVDKLIVNLRKLQKDCAKTQDDLEKELQLVKTSLEKKAQAKRVKIKDLEQRIKSTGCVNNAGDFFKAVFSFGISCAFDSNLKKDLKNMKAALAQELALIKRLLTRMIYFEGINNLAKTLTGQATGLLESTKQFRQQLYDSKTEIEEDYKSQDIDDNMGDVDFANDFAEGLLNNLNKLEAECDRVMKDCKARKTALDNALIGEFKEEDETQVVM